MQEVGHGDGDDVGPGDAPGVVAGEELAQHLGRGVGDRAGSGGVTGDGEEASALAGVDLDAHSVVVPVQIRGAAGDDTQAVAAGADLGIATHGLDDLTGPRGDRGALPAVVKVDADDTLYAGEDKAQTVVARGVELEGSGR